MEPAFLSKVVHPPGVGDRTYVAEATITVAGLCRSCTGFATTRGTARLSDRPKSSTASGAVIRSPVIRSPVIRGPVIRSPVIRGPVIRS